MSTTSADATIKVLRNIFARHGLPRQVVSDNGRQFVSDNFRQFLHDNGIRHITVPVYHPSSNGLAERFVQNLKKVLKCNYDNPDLAIANFLLAYRNSPHGTTGETPAQLLLGRSLRSRLDLVRPSVHDTVSEKQKVVETKASKFKVNDEVMVRTYHGSKWLHGKIIMLEGSRNAIVDVGHAIIRRSLDQLLYRHSIPESDSDSSALPTSGHSQDELGDIASSSPSRSRSSSPAPSSSGNRHRQSESNSSGSALRRYPDRIRQPPLRYPNN